MKMQHTKYQFKVSRYDNLNTVFWGISIQTVTNLWLCGSGKSQCVKWYGLDSHRLLKLSAAP